MPSYSAAEVFYVRVDPGISGPDELLKALYYLLWFPGYFGFNWDALYDCLSDLEWIPYRKIVVVHERLPDFADEDLKIYLEVLRDAVASWSESEAHELEVFFRKSDQCRVESILAS
ncbi:barstar family protein [Pseudomonas sp. NPDC086581]|uniref:barstar family protein n=1 Tax=Pseudomonas sp. NPDC086581 TaxID=3364432 RepID=UPI00380346C5